MERPFSQYYVFSFNRRFWKKFLFFALFEFYKNCSLHTCNYFLFRICHSISKLRYENHLPEFILLHLRCVIWKYQISSYWFLFKNNFFYVLSTPRSLSSTHLLNNTIPYLLLSRLNFYFYNNFINKAFLSFRFLCLILS